MFRNRRFFVSLFLNNMSFEPNIYISHITFYKYPYSDVIGNIYCLNTGVFNGLLVIEMLKMIT